jgi:phosphoenolpyruvate carboxykinase (ATP)
MPLFGFEIPKAVEDSSILDPRSTWEDKDAYDAQARKLAETFISNFKTLTGTDPGKALEKAERKP